MCVCVCVCVCVCACACACACACVCVCMYVLCVFLQDMYRAGAVLSHTLAVPLNAYASIVQVHLYTHTHVHRSCSA